MVDSLVKKASNLDDCMTAEFMQTLICLYQFDKRKGSALSDALF